MKRGRTRKKPPWLCHQVFFRKQDLVNSQSKYFRVNVSIPLSKEKSFSFNLDLREDFGGFLNTGQNYARSEDMKL